MSKLQQDEIISYDQGFTDLQNMNGLETQLNAAYRKVLLDPKTTAQFPHMKITFLTGENGPAAQFALLWDVQEKIREHGVKMDAKIIPETNHFVSNFFFPDGSVLTIWLVTLGLSRAGDRYPRRMCITEIGWNTARAT